MAKHILVYELLQVQGGFWSRNPLEMIDGYASCVCYGVIVSTPFLIVTV